MKRLVAVFLLLFATAQSAPVTTIIIVRHAERASKTDKDSPLSDAGLARANTLASMLRDAEIKAVYVTPYKRTQQTAKPTADEFKVEPVVVATGNTYAADLVERIRKEHTGDSVLVVSHSNTIPQILEQLGIGKPHAIADDEYDNLYVVTAAGGTTKVTTLRFGAR
jgi:broad specificity phosphatase PhoE